jgi:hypothetical protein
MSSEVAVTIHANADERARQEVSKMATKLNRMYGWHMPSWGRNHGPWWHVAHIWRVDSTPIGFAAFRGAFYPLTLPNNYGAIWALNRAWFEPEWRGRGLLWDQWDLLGRLHGDFVVVPPVADPMIRFLTKHDLLRFHPEVAA